MRLEEQSPELRDRIVSRYRSEEGYQKIVATVAFIILKGLELPGLFPELAEPSGKTGLCKRHKQETNGNPG